VTDSGLNTIAHRLRATQTALAEILALDSAEARIEAGMLLSQALGGVNRAWLIAHERDVLSAEQRAEFEVLLQRRLAGEPLAYVLGEREFFGLVFKVTPAVLIPRADTETLVEQALIHLPSPRPSPGGGGGRVLDLGVGSGAIALSIAHTRSDVAVTAVDASAAALAVARENGQRLGLGNVHLLQSDWFSALAGEVFDLIVSNPPYIAAGDPHLVQGDLPQEPVAALTSGAEGLDDIRRIVAEAPLYLASGGWLLLEHGYDQAERVRALLVQRGFSEVYSACDLAGIERVSGGCWLDDPVSHP